MPIADGAPTDETKALISDFVAFRGGFISSFGQVEFLFGRLISRLTASQKIEFVAVDFPFRVESRINAIKTAFRDSSALQPMSAQALCLAKRLEDEIDLRNFLVHGFAKYYAQQRTWLVRKCQPRNDNPWHEDEIRIAVDDVPAHVSRMGLLNQEATHFLYTLNDEFLLEF